MEDLGPNALIYALLLILPVSALIARRVPFLRVVSMLATWAALFGIATYVFTQRERFDPYLARVASALNISDQKVVGKEVRIRMSPDGHFWANATIGGLSKRLLIDSGATVTALSAQTATAAGLTVEKPMFPLLIQTANGQVSARSATVAELRLGNIVARELSVVVSPAFGETNVLGMNFLSRLKSWRVEGRTLILTPHHPQDFT
ncbi:MAG: peptidase [Sphingomonas bacterium]|uniref:retropepsin-like aspartic protease family protein n=1 Tax=Sphingomonas bacterium TaxID=1895847 RepID=UPI00261841A9|nr:TIGR02281 family clan AA aspartic protease [Sphingomonas bacterium]MDB5696400.1 peptidase [Sphingomonas bacterium]